MIPYLDVSSVSLHEFDMLFAVSENGEVLSLNSMRNLITQ